MGFKVDLTGVKLREFEPVDIGRYRAKVDDLVYTPKSKRSGQPKVQLTFTLLEGLDASNKGYDPATNRKAFYEVSLQEQSLWNLKRTLVALGDNPEDLEGELDIDKADYVGRECIVLIGQEGYEGINRQRTRRIEPLVDKAAAAVAPGGAIKGSRGGKK